MLRDVFYYGKKPNVHPREKFAKNFEDAKRQATTEHFWIINEFCDYRGFDWDFDFEFLPDEDVWAEEHINIWPSQHQKDSGTWLVCADNDNPVYVYRADVGIVNRKSSDSNWVLLDRVNESKFDFSWHPDPTDPPYIYKWGCKFYPAQIKHVLEYRVPGATQEKYMTQIAELLPNWDYITENYKIDHDKFDMSWRPNPLDPPLVYAWGNKWVDGKIHPTLVYHVPGATETKHMPEMISLLPDLQNFELLEDIDKTKFDFTWKPDPSAPPYIYVWGNQWNKPEDKISVQYVVEGATEYKYMESKTVRLPCMDNWYIPNNVDTTGFDFSWEPSPADPAYIYEFGTQHQKTGGPQYIVEGATEKKYVSTQEVKALPTKDNWVIPNNIDVKDFDFSWHPDSTDPLYIYQFGTQWALSGGPKYIVEGATEVKYMENMMAKALPNKEHWDIPPFIDVDSFDFSWHPYAEDEPYIYQFGTQHQKTGGPRYITPGTHKNSAIKYIDTRILKATRLPNKKAFAILNNYKIKDFDFSWHPDTTEEPYIYVFGNNQYSAEIMPTIEYVVPSAKQIKYINNVAATLDADMTNWEVPDNIDTTGFDFSWKPNPKDPPYIYQFGTQWQKTGGPRYVVPDATDIKYVDLQKVKTLPNKKRFSILNNCKVVDFDFSWHPDDSEEPYIYVFGNNQYSAEIMPTIEYSVPGAKQVKYINDIIAKLGEDKTNWEIPENIDVSNIDFSWKPNPKDPPYIYQFGTQWQKTGGPRYVVGDATEVKYIESPKAIALPNKNNFNILNEYVIADFDFSWHPDDSEEPYIYVFGNNQYPAEIMPTLEYRVNGATQIKYVSDIVATLGVDMRNWVVPNNVVTTGFDFSWKPNPKDPLYIYQFGTQWQPTGGPQYIVNGATEKKYIDTMKVTRLPSHDNWVIPNHIDITDFDFSWHPNDIDKPYIYQFGTQWALSGGPKYVVEGATEKKYIEVIIAKAAPNMENWIIPDDVDTTGFDFSWHPYEEDDPYVYEFGTQWQKTGGPRYVANGATETSPIKYIDRRIQKSKKLPNKTNWEVPSNIDESTIDFSWHPDSTEPAYIYEFGTQWQKTDGPRYVTPGSDEFALIKYVDAFKSRRLPDLTNWEVPEYLDTTNFDFSWHPDSTDLPYTYEFGTQWQKTGGPRYVVERSSDIKYVGDFKAKKLPDISKFTVCDNLKIKDFDYSWHPDNTEEPYIYVFGNNQYPAEIMPTIEYKVEGASQVKYVQNVIATLDVDMTHWVVPKNIDTTGFDFTWKPNPKDPAYIYEFGTQHQKTGGPRYVVEGATEVKYIDTIKVKALPNMDRWVIPNHVDVANFDFSWHPDNTDPLYIYQFGTQWALSGGPRYVMEGATELKYMENMTAQALPNRENWVVPKDIDAESFDFSWHPYAEDDPYVYEFGTQWQKTGGPKYVTPGVSGTSATKYIDRRILKAKRLPSMNNWVLPDDVEIKDFDYSWHPDSTETTFIYEFGTQWNDRGGPKYVPPSAKLGLTQTKYIPVTENKATLAPNRNNWYIPDNLDVSDVDFSWVPHPDDPAYIYQFGTQWQKTGGVKYIPPGTDELSLVKYVDGNKAKKLQDHTYWIIPDNIDKNTFDFSWHPDDTDYPYIYQFGTQHQKTGGPIYKGPNVTDDSQIKYVESIKATAISSTLNWDIPDNVDVTNFDFSWHPDFSDGAYIYQFGTQWQKTGGPRYVVDGATEVKYIDVKVKALSCSDKFNKIADVEIKDFDYSWHPDDTDEPYIYVFGNNQYPAEVMPTIEYRVSGATQTKYVSNVVATLAENKKNWVVPDDIDVTDFDFSWIPNPKDPPYVYQFGTQWQKTGGPKFIVDGAVDVKYVDTTKAKMLPNKNKFTTICEHEIENFDYSWHPDETEEPYNYVFGNTQYPAEIMPTIAYNMENATATKYISNPVAKLAINKTNWVVPDNLDVTNFDFSWIPNPKDPAYIYQFGTQWQKTGGPKYIVSDAIDIKYVEGSKAKRLPDSSQFVTLNDYEILSFDYSWHPDETEEPYIYVFGNNQYVGEEMPTIEYKMEGATNKKFIHDVVAKLAPDKKYWTVPDNIDLNTFDFSWRPNPNDPPYVYQFGTQWQKTGGPKYTVPGAEQIKYVDEPKAKRLPNKANFVSLVSIDSFDYSWHPDETEEPYIYVFGNTQYPAEEMATVEYRVPNATQKKYVHDVVATLSENKKSWIIPELIDVTRFDFTWLPNPHDPPYIYQFGTQHQKTGGPKYIVDGATEVKYVETNKAYRLSSMDNWTIPDGIDVSDFDFSWHPDELAPPYIYQFGTLLNDKDGPIYMAPDNNGEVVNKLRVVKPEAVVALDVPVKQYYVKTSLKDLVDEHPNEIFWALNENIDYTEFDFSWRPSIEQVRYVHVFGSSASEMTQTYFINSTMYAQGYQDLNFIDDRELTAQDLSKLFKKPDMFFVDKSNPESKQRFEKLKAKFGDRIQKTRYLNSWVDTINRCINRANTKLCWILNSELDYSNFDFNYYPNPWQLKMVHVFGTQWSHWGTTFMVNRETFSDDTKYIKIIEHLSNLNFVKDDTKKAKATENLYDIFVVDHGNKELFKVFKTIQNKACDKAVTTIEYKNNYLDTFKEILSQLPERKEQYIWICSSICDYTNFDFTYICDPFAREQLHVFPSDKQKYGDTFLVNVNKLRELIEGMKILQQYNRINFNQHMRVSRYPAPVIVTEYDTHVPSIMTDFNYPYAVFVTEDNHDIQTVPEEPMSIWSDETKNILVTSTGGTRIIVPKEAKYKVETQLYDYPYIKKSQTLAKSKPMDIVFLSNGEKQAEQNFKHLEFLTKDLGNRLVWVNNVHGRVQAYHAAAEASTTPWFFTVFAKLKVSPRFDFNWQPDRLQIPKHYIFNAKNPVNGLVYGHQGIIAYNKNLVLRNEGAGLDFTLDDPHESINMLSGVANYNTDEYSTWRTAFREVIKLQHDTSEISKDRLQKWLTVAEGDFAEFSIQGANDAVEYFESVNGDYAKLKLSYEWDWLLEYFKKKY